ncbi:MAG: hypothetical protein ACYTEL_00505 [Planctomycetota bacterium]|jgi:hypothetical protein
MKNGRKKVKKKAAKRLPGRNEKGQFVRGEYKGGPGRGRSVERPPDPALQAALRAFETDDLEPVRQLAGKTLAKIVTSTDKELGGSKLDCNKLRLVASKAILQSRMEPPPSKQILSPIMAKALGSLASELRGDVADEGEG